ncbi:hypothetical protein [Pseudobacteriovorax antillogorgiicola]|uniref:Uncharacterized protein n=1 Tax=Pseudobacteriovorax antillogorgiicola TaxID=1513793 RepID=A0A1Y6BQG2_9BACT|nr:hypothetical protein [Pseudobacteriovorax antillogorgiicola]TCS53724.1 hypothetical protein EDD56_10733 [Pseudobacteriovorax antillogorgiicola]SMF22801.1 hypothetical protein SAMN06296036_107239 [Pseudobacteriovorax antillogorgiicola]
MRFRLLITVTISIILYSSAVSMFSQSSNSSSSITTESEPARSIDISQIWGASKLGDFSMPDDSFYDTYEPKVEQLIIEQESEVISEDIRLLRYRLGGDEDLLEYVEMTRDILPSIEDELSDLHSRKQEVCFDLTEICRVVENILRIEARVERLRDLRKISTYPDLQSDLSYSLSVLLASLEDEKSYLDHLLLDQAIDSIVVQEVEGLVATQVDYEAVIDRHYATASL